MKKNSKSKSAKPRVSSAQTGRGRRQPFNMLERYTPLAAPAEQMYDALREAIPIIDAAIEKLVRLTGGFKVVCANRSAERHLQTFLNDVKVGASGAGINFFITQFLDRLLTWGTAAAEIVPYSNGEIAALYCANNSDIELKNGANPLEIEIYTYRDGEIVPVIHPERIIISALKPMPGEIRGTSLLRGLPFVSSILLKIYNAMGANWDRFGNLRYAVTYKPSGSVLENTLGGDVVSEISAEWSRAMNSEEGVRDFVAVGDVDVKVIGADNQVLDSEVPVRQILEQIVAKLGIPPFMLGLSWSSTERMSQQQADILTSEIESYRALLTPILRKICRFQLTAMGYTCEPEIVWDDINLQDEVELSRARLLNAQAMVVEENGNITEGK